MVLALGFAFAWTAEAAVATSAVLRRLLLDRALLGL
jgi:hypothetical protein